MIVSSAGFGHGPFGRGPCGHGPWLTFPHTPDAGYGNEREWGVGVVPFEDGTEQRFLGCTTRTELLTFPYTRPDSWLVCDIRSWVGVLQGGTSRVIIREPRTGLATVARLDEDGCEMPRTNGRLYTDIALRWACEHRLGHAYEVYVSSPTLFFRFNERVDAASLYDASGQGFHARVVQGGSLGQPGIIPGDRNTCVDAFSFVAAHGDIGSWTQERGVAVVIQPLWPPPDHHIQPLWAWAPGGSSISMWVFGLNSFGEPAVWYGSSHVIVATGTCITDNQPHHLAYVLSGMLAHGLYLDGTLIASVSSFNAVNLTPKSCMIGGIPDSLEYYYGRMQDFVYWRSDLSGLGEGGLGEGGLSEGGLGGGELGAGIPALRDFTRFAMTVTEP